MLVHSSAQIAGRLKMFSVVLPIPKTRQLLKKDCMCPWLLPLSLFLKQMCSVHYGENSLWSCQRCLMKTPTLVVRVVCLQLVEKQVSLITRRIVFFIKMMPGDQWISALKIYFSTPSPTHPLPPCGLFWPWLFDNFEENLFSLSPLETLAVQLGWGTGIILQ